LGDRRLPKEFFGHVEPLAVDRVFQDLGDIQDKVDRRTLERLRRMEIQKSGLSSRIPSTEEGELEMSLRTLLSVIKIQRAVRERLYRLLSVESAKHLEDELSKRLNVAR